MHLYFISDSQTQIGHLSRWMKHYIILSQSLCESFSLQLCEKLFSGSKYLWGLLDKTTNGINLAEHNQTYNVHLSSSIFICNIDLKMTDYLKVCCFCCILLFHSSALHECRKHKVIHHFWKGIKATSNFVVSCLATVISWRPKKHLNSKHILYST